MPRFFSAPSLDELAARHGARFRWLVLSVVGLGAVSSLLASTSFTVAVPALMAAFHVGPSDVQWTVTGFMAAMTVGMLPASWLLEHLGFRRLFLGATLVLSLAGIAGALSNHFGLIVFLRIVQGVMAGVLQPLGTIAVMRLFDARERGRASGVLGFGIVLAPALAPSIAGMLLDRFGWPAIFLLNLPTCILAMIVGLRVLPRPQPRSATAFDWLGLALLAGFSLAVVEGVANFQRQGPTAPWTLAFLGMAAACLAGFLVHARRAPEPIIDLRPFAVRSFAMGTLVTFVYGFGLYASAYLIPVFLQQALHMSASAAGVALLPSGLVLACTIPVAGRMADRLSPVAVLMAGLVLFCLSFLFFGLTADHISYGEIIAFTVLGRLGLGQVLPALSIATLRDLGREWVAQASVVSSYARQLGGVMGVAVAAVFVAWRQSAYEADPRGVFQAYAEGFLMVAAVFVAAIVAASFMRQRAATR